MQSNRGLNSLVAFGHVFGFLTSPQSYAIILSNVLIEFQKEDVMTICTIFLKDLTHIRSNVVRSKLPL